MGQLEVDQAGLAERDEPLDALELIAFEWRYAAERLVEMWAQAARAMAAAMVLARSPFQPQHPSEEAESVEARYQAWRAGRAGVGP